MKVVNLGVSQGVAPEIIYSYAVRNCCMTLAINKPCEFSLSTWSESERSQDYTSLLKGRQGHNYFWQITACNVTTSFLQSHTRRITHFYDDGCSAISTTNKFRLKSPLTAVILTRGSEEGTDVTQHYQSHQARNRSVKLKQQRCYIL